MEISYEGIDGEIYFESLKEVNVSGTILHASPDRNVEGIRSNGLKTKMPKTKSLIDLNAIYCTVPSAEPSTFDLFRYYEDWSIVVIDTDKIPTQKWYIDFLAQDDSSNNGNNIHIMTFENIPKEAIKKIVK